MRLVGTRMFFGVFASLTEDADTAAFQSLNHRIFGTAVHMLARWFFPSQGVRLLLSESLHSL